MNYQIAEVYTKKEYECKKCNGKIYYAKIADETGKLITTDGMEPHGRYGKDSNVLSGAVDALVKDRLHDCTKHFVEEAVQKLEKPNTQKFSTHTADEPVKWTFTIEERDAVNKLIDLKIESIMYTMERVKQITQKLGKQFSGAELGMITKIVRDEIRSKNDS